MLVMVMFVTALPIQAGTIVNNTIWREKGADPDDPNGYVKASFGGHITLIDGVYYWVGNDPNEEVNGADIHIYSSTTLGSDDWTHVTMAVDGPPKDPDINWDKGKNCTLLRSPATGKYVIVAKNGLKFYESDAIEGPYTLVRTLGTNDLGGRSGWKIGGMSTFQEGDDAYVITSRRDTTSNAEPPPRYIGIYKLTPDFLNVESEVNWIGPIEKREAMWLFKKDELYYMTASHTAGWNPSDCYYRTATSLDGEWSDEEVIGMDPEPTTNKERSHKSQARWIMKIGNQWVFAGDRYPYHKNPNATKSSYDLDEGFNIFCPVSFDENGHPTVTWKETWTLDLGSSGPELIENGSFEDGFNGWSPWNNPTIVGDSQEGDSAVRMLDKGSVNQWVDVAPSTTYTLSAYVKTSDASKRVVLGAKDPDNVLLGKAEIYSTSYTRHQVTFTTDASTTSVKIYCWQPPSGTATAHVDGVSLVASSGTPTVTVPNVTGQDQSSAEALITGAELSVGSVSTASSNAVAAGDVISQFPTSGSTVATGSSVDLVVSTGPPTISVPAVVGLSQASAEASISSAGLAVGTVTTAASMTVAVGNVISQTPVEGTDVIAGTSVGLVVSTGPPTVLVPDVVGLSQSAAESAITAVGLSVGTVTTEFSSSVDVDDVISQGTPANSSVVIGSTVDLVVSLGEDTSPQLVRMTVSSVSNTAWAEVDLGQSYSSPVIVATPIYPDNTTPSVATRIRNVTSTGFELKVDRADGQSGEVTIDVSVIAVDEGVYTLASDGVKMEAVKVTSSLTSRRGNWLGEAQSYQNSYTNPVLVGQVMSTNDPDWSAFWSFGLSRFDPASASSLNVGKHVAEDSDSTRSDEVIGYIVVEQGNGTINGVAYEAGVGADTVRGTGDSAVPYSYSLSGSLSSAGSAAVSISGMDGNNGAWGVLAGNPAISPSSISMYALECQMLDDERFHTDAQMSYIVFE